MLPFRSVRLSIGSFSERGSIVTALGGRWSTQQDARKWRPFLTARLLSARIMFQDVRRADEYALT